MEENDLQEILATLPILEKSVWDAFQKKQYDLAEKNLTLVLENIDLDGWSLIYWEGILNGIPAVLGDLNESEWKNMARPAIIKSITATANGKAFSVVLQNLELNEQLDFINLFVKNLPGATSEEKLEWLKQNRPSLYVFIISVPARNSE